MLLAHTAFKWEIKQIALLNGHEKFVAIFSKLIWPVIYFEI